MIGIIGCGRMGAALAHGLADAGFPLLLASRYGLSAARLAGELPPGQARAEPLRAVAARATVLIMATPVEATFLEIAPQVRDLVRRKPVIDVSNPGAHPLLARTGCASGAELIACALPGGAVVKALNCVAARQVGQVPGRAMTVPIAGDDPAAKQAVTAIVGKLGMDVADAGDLRCSRWIEGLAELLMRLGSEAGVGDAVAFRLIRLTPLASGQGGARGFHG